jgi:hypothetical protein
LSNRRLVPLNLVALDSAPTGGMRTGDLYFNSVESKVYVYDGEAWIVATGGGTGGGVTASSTAPTEPEEGQGWFDTTSGNLYIYYDDFWIEVGANGGAIGPQGETGVVAATSPLSYDAETKTVSIDTTGLGGATGAGGDEVFFENDVVVSANYTITAGKNAGTFGPITVDTGVTVTIPSGSTWSII